MSNSSQNSAPKPAPLFKIIAISAGVALLLGLIGWILGARQGNEELAQQQSTYEQKISAANSDLQKTQRNLSIAQNRVHLMQARAALYRSAIDLDKRNFGTANTHLKEAAQSLGEIKAANDNLKVAEISSLQNVISKTSINVAVNLEDQRAQVLEFARQLNELMP